MSEAAWRHREIEIIIGRDNEILVWLWVVESVCLIIHVILVESEF